MRAPLDVSAAGLVFLALVSACSSSNDGDAKGVTPEAHTWLSIVEGSPHALGTVIADGTTLRCESCHPPTAATFHEFNCVDCHQHQKGVNDRLHLSVAGYSYESAACLGCHPAAIGNGFDHAGITSECAACHDEGTPFAALPRDGFTHPPRQGADCASCHETSSWSEATAAPSDSFDPARSLEVSSLIPTWAGPTITAVTAATQTLHMKMNHASPAVPSAALTSCENCHADASAGQYYPGEFHSSLANLGIPQPTACQDCHQDAPAGFVGPLATAPAREPSTGEMKHDAVLWAHDAPSSAPAVPKDCAVCHASPAPTVDARWTMNRLGTGPATFHQALATADLSQPGSCIDCHANSRPARVLTSADAALPLGVEYDHAHPEAMGDCAACHAASAAAGFVSWAGGQQHAPQSATPATCLPCHAAERPTSTTGWQSTTYASSPFDYVTNSAGITHGAGQDCALCHRGPGTGKWGGTQNWIGGQFAHGPQTISAQGCIACHTTQRPDLLPGATAPAMAALLGFDHAINGTGDCFGCHQATVAAGAYANLVNPKTGTLPGGDWKGGISYPGSTLVAAPNDFVTVQQLQLNRSGTFNLVTSASAVTSTLYNAMLHTSPAIPQQLFPGPANNPDNSTCWHCHTHSNGTVTSFADGKFHAALTGYSATPGGTVTPLPQPTSGCNDCHAQQRPSGIVERAGSTLEPMDHSALFTQQVTLNGVPVGGVAAMDCSACHATSGVKWADGTFHANIAGAVPKDCVVCHYPTMADAPKADVTLGTTFAMKHRSPLITFQNCDTCHASALAKGDDVPVVAALWKPGAFHSSVTAQPAACNDCHQGSAPPQNAPTQSTNLYSLALGATATNQGQWMNHGAPPVVGKDCVTCHAADARSAQSAWSKSTPLHAQVAKPARCDVCHGTANGGGTAIGGKNNLPSGLTNSSTLTTASAAPGSGIPAGTFAQITHSDVNVTSRDCGVCHTQAGPSLGAGVQGKEWAQAKFHTVFTSASPLVMNKTSGRCSNCHMNVKPGPNYAGQNHTAFTNVSGSDDCSACHSWPGTGTATSANWKGAAGAPSIIFVGGFTIPKPPATTTTSIQAGIANLPHPAVPTGGSCTSCHQTSSGGTHATGYDHASTLINAKCSACHEAGSDLVATPWNGATNANNGAGDTRPYTLSSVVANYDGDSMTVTYPNHFFPVDCYQCHVAPTGLAKTSTGTTYDSRWNFPHIKSRMSNPATCKICHPNGT